MSTATTNSSSSRISVSTPSDSSFTVPTFYRPKDGSHPPHWKSSDPFGSGKKGFVSPWPSNNIGQNGFLSFFKARMTEWDEKPLPLKGKGLPNVKTATWTHDNQSPESNQIVYTWLGHAACHLQIPLPSQGGENTKRLKVLTDPVFSYRCSPVQFMGPARYTDAPTSVSDMASEQDKAWPDVILISHNHYDHLDYNTIKEFVSRPNDRSIPTFVVPLGLKAWFTNNFRAIPTDQIVELDWWGQRDLTIEGNEARVRVTCTPAQHFSGRSISDRDHTLWASYAMKVLSPTQTTSPLAKIWFSGDSGYRSVPRGTPPSEEENLPHCPAFEEIGSTLGPFDLSLIACGAYDPRSVMSPIHMNPKEAVNVHQHVRSKKSFGIHHATFRLTPEDVDEPARLFLREAKEKGLKQGECEIIDIGQSVNVDIVTGS
ncbi:unnamed protein product [Sympodiomycopsis kandeliae]